MRKLEYSDSSNKDESILPMVWFGLIYGLISSLVLFIILRMRKEPELSDARMIKKFDSGQNLKIKLEPISSEQNNGTDHIDNLTLINGIGPVISKVLVSNGIDSFLKLSKLKPEEINEILRTQKLRLANPESWPKQAKFAALKDWEALKAYQKSIK
jgi:predicted flap endonuclease-1-like 5' DNA nuclease